ncbi:hypothetical protein K450DRAFT_246142 [Umbelopsis ramanniana AG]|uniref:BTB domain-containing protein n=1 Tax=Umbelopsis ramanniana AG TaxID=1314678 RepID=A0AAD5EA89_UMBRA|nr:uncharacterized protein K450DRAFT_246142 [Umbelopsis ramanniana AG]KAI8578515.1 hypothetical protein K450DRAFT_246142 [Umbelopsis ramanniana AG]
MDLALYLKMVDSDSHPLKGIRKKVRIVFVVEDVAKSNRIGRADYGKTEHPVWFSEKHATWGEESLLPLDRLGVYAPYSNFSTSRDRQTVSVKFEVLKTRSDPPILNRGVGYMPFMQKYFNDAAFSDVTFKAKLDNQERTFYAHKVVMASASSWFETLFTNGMKESFSNEITLADTDPATFEFVLRHCYGMEFDIENIEQAENIVVLSDRFGIDRLKDEAFRHIRLELCPNNIWRIWELADKHSDKRTYLTCEDYVSQNIPTLIKHSSFFQASPNILEVILKHDMGNFPSEENLFEAVVRWATYEENIGPSMYDDNSDQASTESFENLSTVALQENPTFPEPMLGEMDFSVLKYPFFSKPTSPIMLRSDEDGVIRRHSIGTVGQRKREQEKLATDRRNSADSDSFPSFRLMLLPYLLQHIRFPLMSPQYLTSNVISNEIVMNAEGMKDLLIEAFAYHVSGTQNNSKPTRFRARIQRVD